MNSCRFGVMKDATLLNQKGAVDMAKHPPIIIRKRVNNIEYLIRLTDQEIKNVILEYCKEKNLQVDMQRMHELFDNTDQESEDNTDISTDDSSEIKIIKLDQFR